jgi:hypothetical protein
MTISLGCSAMSVLVAAAASGLGMTVETGAGGEVRLGVAGTGADDELARLFPALISRVTDKRGYPPAAIEPPQLPLPQGIGVHYAVGRQSLDYLADLHRQAVGELAATGSFARELASWLRTDPADPRRDGMIVPPHPDAHTCGLAVAPLTAVVENPRTRQAAATLIPAGQHLQMLFRLGRSPGPLPPTARRDPTWRRPPESPTAG